MRLTPLPRHLPPPRGGVDPVDDARSALALVAAAIDRPLLPQMLVAFLDDFALGTRLMIVDNVHGRGVTASVTAAACHIALSEIPGTAQLVLASVRPGGGVEADDVDQWLEASAVADFYGLRLVEWYVISEQGFCCPRDLIGEPERW
jgi:hypothetical protein